MMKRLLSVVLAGVFAFGFLPGVAQAGEVDLLVQKLVEKGILTPNEAQILMDETKQDVAKQNAKGMNEMLPAWVQTTKVKGDLRLRYQTEQLEASGTSHERRNRGRIRYRLGVETKPNEKVTVAAGLSGAEKSSTTDDARSTNITMSNSFDRGNIRLDYAYVNYRPNSWMGLTGGKYNALGTGTLWYTTDMMWDSDINQEGASVHVDLVNVMAGDVFMNAGYWVLDESRTTNLDPGMYYAQAGITFSPNPVQIKLAGTFYGTHSIREQVLDGRPGSPLAPSTTTVYGNSQSSATQYKYDFSKIYAASAEVVYNWPEETSFPIKMAGLFGDYVTNPDPSSMNNGWAAGLKFGHKKVGAVKGDWQFKYQYVRLGKDAWFDAFPDSDRYAGNTNIKGHEWILDIGLAKNVSLGLDYYRTEILKGSPYDQNLFQVDLNFKF